jgi:ubiquinone/menaquinone biosynthesis C-methylase UbiE
MGDFGALSAAYDSGMRPLERLIFRRLRRQLFPSVGGRVLELGAGTGVNLPLYSEATYVVAVDASAEMLSWAARRLSRASVALVQADAQHLPFADESFDAVAGSLVFCSVAVPEKGLAEGHRALRPGGRLVLLEHMRGSGIGAWLTDLLQPLWGIWSTECRLDRETADAVASAGFRDLRVEHHAWGIVRTIEGVSAIS